MRKQVVVLFLILTSAIYLSGCIDDIIPVDEVAETTNTSEYALDPFIANDSCECGINTTTFYLSPDSPVKAVYILENVDRLEVVPLEDITNPGSDVLSNIVIEAKPEANNGNPAATVRQLSTSGAMDSINYTLSEESESGQTKQVISFNQSLTGFVAYTMEVPMGQDFMYVPSHLSTVRVVLPEGYTTGNQFIGKVEPEPDSRYVDGQDREVLVWNNLRQNTSSSLSSLAKGFLPSEDEEEEEIEFKTLYLKFYSEDAPRNLLIGTSILGAGVLLVIGNYLRNRKKLNETIRMAEEDWKKDKKR
ncbi:hypothetical protein EFE42_01135 [Methanohalophilus sp. RSK]|uniref:DUF5803 family protein n=1 Tax=Methanohalophilus sp. RSK TaxID=2485783 RepID=UPI000F43A759|nr:DUF5803 family protein [Methanohalophilus sp. RSK]RNI15872.1 hypothetical protein EFE42_01135 [Methanohalophilus sp. RSK]